MRSFHLFLLWLFNSEWYRLSSFTWFSIQFFGDFLHKKTYTCTCINFPLSNCRIHTANSQVCWLSINFQVNNSHCMSSFRKERSSIELVEVGFPKDWNRFTRHIDFNQDNLQLRITLWRQCMWCTQSAASIRFIESFLFLTSWPLLILVISNDMCEINCFDRF